MSRGKERLKQDLKKWLPIFIFIIMVSPSLFYFVLDKGPKQIKVVLNFKIDNQDYYDEIETQENATLISILQKYPLYIDNNTIFCLGQLCEDEGNWTFLINNKKINPFEYKVKENDVIVLRYDSG